MLPVAYQAPAYTASPEQGYRSKAVGGVETVLLSRLARCHRAFFDHNYCDCPPSP